MQKNCSLSFRESLIYFTRPCFLYIVDREGLGRQICLGKELAASVIPVRLNGRSGSESLLFICNFGTKNNLKIEHVEVTDF